MRKSGSLNRRQLLIAASLFSAGAWPLADLALANPSVAFSANVLIWLVGITLALGLAAIGLARITGTLERSAAILAPLIMALFSFAFAEPHLRTALLAFGLKQGVALIFGLIWTTLAVLLYRTTRAAEYRTLLLVIPIAALTTTVLAGALQFDRQKAESERQKAVVHATFLRRPNVYHFLFDGLARPDVLRSQLGLDVSQATAKLAHRGFVNAPDAQTAHLSTIPSITSILNPMTSPEKATDIDQPSTEVVQIFRSNGYRFAQYGEVFSFAGCKGLEDVCLSSTRFAFSELDIVMIKRTPFYSLLKKKLLGSTSSRNLFKNLEDISSKTLSRPTYTFSYMVPPHPPFVFGENCIADKVDGHDFRAWRLTSVARYGYSYRCVMDGLAAITDKIVARDPTAIIIVSGDHGTMFFRSQVDGRTWSAKAIAERRPVYVAARIPPDCTGRFQSIRFLPEIYPAIFACLEAVPPVVDSEPLGATRRPQS